MKRRHVFNRLTAFLLAALIVASLGSVVSAEEEGVSKDISSDESSSFMVGKEARDYEKYLEKHAGYEYGEEITINGSEYTGLENDPSDTTDVGELLGADSTSVYTGDMGSVTWTVDIPRDSLYAIMIQYTTVKGKGLQIERNLKIDGAYPFSSAKNLVLNRTFRDILVDGKFETDYYGNHLRPACEEVHESQSAVLMDSIGYYNEPLVFAFSKGTHQITLEAIREAVIIDSITLVKTEKLPSYDEYRTAKKDAGINPYSNKEESINVPAVYQNMRSNAMNYPIADMSSPKTDPVDVYKELFNTVGKDRWANNGEWVEWEIDAPEDALYTIAPRFRQDTQAGLFVSRKMYINGEIPFEEAKQLRFDFNSDWQHKALGGENGAYLFHLKKGKNILRLEVVLGEMAPMIHRVEDILNSINEDFLSILSLTGPEPDLYRDYSFNKLIPETVADLTEQSKNLYAVADDITDKVKIEGELNQILRKVAYQIGGMGEKPSSIAAGLKGLKSNLGSLASWLAEAKWQPLEINFFSITAENAELSKADAGFFGALWFEFQKFIASFFIDTRTLGSKYAPEVTESVDAVSVWLGTGRDQAQIIRRLIDNNLMAQNDKIKIDLKLVQTNATQANTGGNMIQDTLLGAVLAGVGPDVTLGIGGDMPVNFAARNAAVNLKQFADYEEVAKRFVPSALTAFEFKDGVYGLPESQVFRMMFYRTDIFERLNLKVPETWNDLYVLITELQKENMDFGMPGDLATVQLLMYQQGEEFYRDGGRKVNLDTDIGIGAFKTMCDFYNQYRLSVQFDILNRFRTGEMPATIADFTTYNQLAVFAPEIKGKWSMAPIPGTVRKDENGKEYIDHTAISTATSIILLNGSNNQNIINDGWEFIKWWTSADMQTEYGIEMESALGPAAKHNTANVEAFSRLPWGKEEYDMITKQRELTVGVPIYPGDYMVGRAVSFAFMRVYDKKANPSEIMMEYIDGINSELERKRKEFEK